MVFVHGCFWHRHTDCALARLPKTRTEFWIKKLDSNRERDKRNKTLLEAAGWRVLTIWECELRDLEAVAVTLTSFLDHEKRE